MSINTKNKNNHDQLQENLNQIGQRAKKVALALANESNDKRTEALKLIAKNIRKNKDKIMTTNQLDIKGAEEKKLSKALIDRLFLDEKRIESIALSVEDIAKLPDPLGKITSSWERPNGLKISRISVPLGVIGMIYESRPNVTVDASALCLKSGNVVILRAGSDSYNSSFLLANIIRKSLNEVGLNPDAVNFIDSKDRQAVGIMLKLDEYIDVIIPRGGKDLCKRVREESSVPTLLHLDGNCHTYIHQDASTEMALTIVKNAKLRRTGVCGATESLVVDRKISKIFVPKIVKMLKENNCQIRGDDESIAIDKGIDKANGDDWYTEYLDSIISLKIVTNINEAIDFINEHGSHHTDAIITNNKVAAEKFIKKIDSAIVMHNTSTQFADGGEFGMGAEIGIATGRLHARGPVGVEQLTTYKYVVQGDGQVRP